MLYAILIFIHVIVCLGLIVIVLIQAGRGGGLAESFTGAESIFGTKTNAFLTKATTVFAVIFFVTCLSLAFVSKQRSKSLLEGKKIPAPAKTSEAKPLEEKPKPEPSQATPSSQPQTQPATQQPDTQAHKTQEAQTNK